jgi:hypothetical protein
MGKGVWAQGQVREGRWVKKQIDGWIRMEARGERKRFENKIVCENKIPYH